MAKVYEVYNYVLGATQILTQQQYEQALPELQGNILELITVHPLEYNQTISNITGEING